MVKTELKEKIVHETRELVFLTIYLTLFLTSLTIYHSMILGENLLSFFHVGYNFIEALILAKVILLGQIFNLGERFAEKSLVIPVVYKAVLFTLLIGVFSFLEHVVKGFLKGQQGADIWRDFASHGLNESLGKLAIAFIVLILLFSFLETVRVIGEEKIYNLFIRRNRS